MRSAGMQAENLLNHLRVTMDYRLRSLLKIIRNCKHIWICEGVKILNNTKIPSNSVLATRCLMTGKIEEENIVIGEYRQK